MDHIRLIRDRLRQRATARDEEEIIEWAICDYSVPKSSPDEFFEEKSEKSVMPRELAEALWKHIRNEPYKKILPRSHIQRFLNAKEILDQIFNAYLAFCPSENKNLAWLIKTARRRVHYGCLKELLPLMILNIEPITDASKAQILFENGIRNVYDLSRSDHNLLSDMLKISKEEAQKVIQTALNIIKLVSEFSGEKSQLNKLAAQTGIKIEDLLDYLLPKEYS
jgi:hypothetical protein